MLFCVALNHLRYLHFHLCLGENTDTLHTAQLGPRMPLAGHGTGRRALSAVSLWTCAAPAPAWPSAASPPVVRAGAAWTRGTQPPPLRFPRGPPWRPRYVLLPSVPGTPAAAGMADADLRDQLTREAGDKRRCFRTLFLLQTLHFLKKTSIGTSQWGYLQIHLY